MRLGMLSVTFCRLFPGRSGFRSRLSSAGLRAPARSAHAVPFGMRTSAIRHWEREGLIVPERDPANGYRLFMPVHVRQIMLIRTLHQSVYSLEKMKRIVQALERQSVEEAQKAAEEALRRINERNRKQYEGASELAALCRELGLL